MFMLINMHFCLLKNKSFFREPCVNCVQRLKIMLSHLESIKACLSLIQTKTASSAWTKALLFGPDSSPGEVSRQCDLVQTENLYKKSSPPWLFDFQLMRWLVQTLKQLAYRGRPAPRGGRLKARFTALPFGISSNETSKSTLALSPHPYAPLCPLSGFR